MRPGSRSRIRARAVAAAGTAALVSALLSGCGVGKEAQPTIIGKKDVPFGLLEQAPSNTTSPGAQEFATVYLAGPTRLVAASRAVPAPVTLRGVLVALGKGPSSAQAAAGLQSPISTAAPMTILRDVRGTVTVGVTSTFTNLAENDQVVAIAQLVFTVTAYPGVKDVEVRIGRRPAKVPTSTGRLSGGPLQRADYQALAPI